MRVAQCIFLFSLVAAVPTAFFRAKRRREEYPRTSGERQPFTERGRLTDGVLTIDLEARVGLWYPEERGTAPRSRYKDSPRLAVRWKFPGLMNPSARGNGDFGFTFAMRSLARTA